MDPSLVFFGAAAIIGLGLGIGAVYLRCPYCGQRDKLIRCWNGKLCYRCNEFSMPWEGSLTQEYGQNLKPRR